VLLMIPKFVSVVAANVCELRNPSTGGPILAFASPSY
jgi:hypothetical protein